MNVQNLKEAIKFITFLALGIGIAMLFAMVSVIMIGVFAYQVNTGAIPVPSSTNTSIQSLATSGITYVVTGAGLLNLVAGISSLVIIVLALLGKVNFVEMSGYKGKGKGKNNMF